MYCFIYENLHIIVGFLRRGRAPSPQPGTRQTGNSAPLPGVCSQGRAPRCSLLPSFNVKGGIIVAVHGFGQGILDINDNLLQREQLSLFSRDGVISSIGASKVLVELVDK